MITRKKFSDCIRLFRYCMAKLIINFSYTRIIGGDREDSSIIFMEKMQ